MAIILCCSNFVWAGQYRETRPNAIKAIQKNGRGSVYNIQLARDGSIRRMRIDDYRVDPNTGELIVEFSRADNLIIVDYSDHKVTFETAESQTEVEDVKDASSNSIHGGVDWTVGVSSGAMSALNYILLENSSANREIEAAYDHISRLQSEVAELWAQVDQITFDLEKSVAALDLKMKTSSADMSGAISHLDSVDQSQIQIIGGESQIDLKNMDWLSDDPSFVSKANHIRSTLLSSKNDSKLKQAFFDISKASLVRADQESYLGNKEESDFLLEIAKTAADVLVGIDPFTGTARSVYEVLTGKNLVTGFELSPAERVVAGLGVFTAGYAITASKAFRAMLPIAKKMAPAAMKSYLSIKNFLIEMGNISKLAKEGSQLRKINLNSATNPKWGLTRKHLTKHFFGEAKHSLSVIDPHGNADIWLKNMSELAQRQASYIDGDGIMNIIKTFPKTDGLGTYKMGVRLFELKDGSFDLVTILTNQSRF